jgi:hypothetical protein
LEIRIPGISLTDHRQPFSVGILLVFFIPRVPGFTIDEDTPLSPATGDFNSSIPIEFMTSPANFSFPAYADFEVSTGSNFIPLKITHLNALLFDLDTNNQVGNGDMYGLTLPAKKFVNIQVPVNFSYVADNSSDITCKVFRFLSVSDTTHASPLQGRTGIMPARIRDNTQTARGQVCPFAVLFI